MKAPPATLPRPLSSLPGGLATRVDSGNRQRTVTDMPPTEGVRPPAPLLALLDDDAGLDDSAGAVRARLS